MGGTIITFYSYKGGTGRTMALANVAWILASNRQRVLVVDWDLEAPGLHRYFHPFLPDKELQVSAGIIDLVWDFASAAMDPTGSSVDGWHHEYARVSPYAVSIRYDFPGKGTIDLVPAGRQDATYARLVGSFDWTNFYERLGGGTFLNALRQDMRDRYDYILIDSRTGLSDSAGICTVQMPDILVNCFTLSTQSIMGASAVAASVRKQRPASDLRIFPVPMRVEDGELVRLDRGRQYARLQMERYLPPGLDRQRYWGGVEVPYRIFYAYEEILATVGDRKQEQSLLSSFERLTGWLTDNRIVEAPPIPESARLVLLNAYERRPAPQTDGPVFLSYAPGDRVWAEWIAYVLDTNRYPVFLDAWDIEPGTNWPSAMEQALDTAGLVLVIGSGEGGLGHEAYVRTLVAEQRLLGRVLPVRVDDRPPPEFLGDIQDVNLADVDEAAATSTLLAAVSRFVSPTTVSRYAVQPSAEWTRFPRRTASVWNLPPRNPNHVHRPALISALRGGTRSGSQQTVHVLYGLIGTGKTQVALEYAHRAASTYDIVWWINAMRPDTIGAQYGELARQAGWDEPDHDGSAALARLRTTRGWLIVFDGAVDLEEVSRWLPGGPGHAIVTSRNGAFRGVAEQVEVDAFTPEESTALLRRYVRNLDATDAHLLAAELGGLPLALAQAAHLMSSTHMPVREYLDLLRQEPQQVLAESPPVDHPPLALVLDRAMRYLTKSAPADAQLMRLCALLGPAPVPIEWITATPALEGPLADVAKSRLPFRRLIGRLANEGLARADGDTIVLHRTTWLLLRGGADHDPADRRQAKRIIVTAAAEDDGTDPVSWPAWAALLPHLVAVEPGGYDDSGLGEVAHRALRYLVDRGAYQEARDLGKRWHPDYRDKNARPGLLIEAMVGVAHHRLGNLAEAHQIHDAVVTKLGAWYGNNDPATLAVRHELAADLRALGRYAHAHAIDEQNRDVRREVLGSDHPDTIRSMVSVARDLHLLARPDALDAAVEAYDRTREVFGADHPETLRAAVNVAVARAARGDYAAARRVDEDTLDRYRRVLGEDHPDTLRAANNLAVDLEALGEPVAARVLDEDILARCRRVLGDDHPDTLRTANNLAVDLTALGDHAAARTLYEDTVARYRRVLGDDHPDTLRAARNLGLSLRQTGDLAAAHEINRETVARYGQVLGGDHPDTLLAAANLAADLDALGDPKAARDLYGRTLDRMRHVLGDDHLDTIAVARGYADNLRSLGDQAGADELDATFAPK